MMRAELLAALVSDLNAPYEHSRTINDTYDFLVAHGNIVAHEINLATKYFETSFKRPVLGKSVMKIICQKYPLLLAKLHKWQFPMDAAVSCNINEELPNLFSGHKTFTSLGGIGFSFGSNTYLLAFMIAQLLLRLPCRLIIYLSPSEIGVFTELSRRAAEAYSFIIVRDLSDYKFSFADLVECQNSGGTICMYDHVKMVLNEHYSMQSSPQNGTTNPYVICSPNATNLALMRLASGSFLRKLGFKDSKLIAVNSRLSKIICSRPIALITNRDKVWVGEGQPWRDSSIAIFNKSIKLLLSSGYSVVRLNTVGEHSSFVHDNYYDLCRLVDITPEIQMEIIANAEILIGTDTGVTGIAQLGGSLQTLIVDGADCRPHDPWSHVMCHTKKLKISNDSLFHSINKQSLKRFLFSSSIWDNETCQKLGLSLVGLVEEEILNGVEEFLDCIANNSWQTKPSLSKLGLVSFTGYDTILTSRTSNMLNSLLKVCY